MLLSHIFKNLPSRKTREEVDAQVRAVQHSHEIGIKDTVGTPYVNFYILLRRNVYEMERFVLKMRQLSILTATR